MHIYKAKISNVTSVQLYTIKCFNFEAPLYHSLTLLNIPCIKEFKSRVKGVPDNPSVIQHWNTSYTSNIAAPIPIEPLKVPIRPRYYLVSLAPNLCMHRMVHCKQRPAPDTELIYILPRKSLKGPKTAT